MYPGQHWEQTIFISQLWVTGTCWSWNHLLFSSQGQEEKPFGLITPPAIAEYLFFTESITTCRPSKGTKKHISNPSADGSTYTWTDQDTLHTEYLKKKILLLSTCHFSAAYEKAQAFILISYIIYILTFGITKLLFPAEIPIVNRQSKHLTVCPFPLLPEVFNCNT